MGAKQASNPDPSTLEFFFSGWRTTGFCYTLLDIGFMMICMRMMMIILCLNMYIVS